MKKGEYNFKLNWKNNDSTGGNKRGKPKRVDDVIEVTREGPSDGVIR